MGSPEALARTRSGRSKLIVAANLDVKKINMKKYTNI